MIGGRISKKEHELTAEEKAARDAREEYEAREAWAKLTAEERTALWGKHEDIAMHFNDLTLRLRLQALAGIGAAALAAGSIFSHQGYTDLRYVGAFLVAASVAWIAVFALDVWYYQALLKGAVRQLYLVERVSPGFNLSTMVERETGRGGKVSRAVFYGAVFVILALGAGVCLYYAKEPPARDAYPCLRACSGTP